MSSKISIHLVKLTTTDTTQIRTSINEWLNGNNTSTKTKKLANLKINHRNIATVKKQKN